MTIDELNIDYLKGKWRTDDLHFLFVWEQGVRLYKTKMDYIEVVNSEGMLGRVRCPVSDVEYSNKTPNFHFDEKDHKYWLSEDVAIIGIDEGGLFVQCGDNLIGPLKKV